MKRRMGKGRVGKKKMWSILKRIIENVITFFNRISGIVFYSDIDIKILLFEGKVCLHKMVVSKEIRIFIPIPSFVRFKNLFSPVVYFQIHKKYTDKKEEKKEREKEKKKKGNIRSSSYRCLPLPGIYRFRNRQSSLWLVRNMYKRFSCWYLPRGICNKAAVSLLMSGKCCGQTAPNESASLIPSHGIGEIGGRKRKSPTGGAAYGMPRNTSTGSKCLLFKSCEKLSRC